MWICVWFWAPVLVEVALHEVGSQVTCAGNWTEILHKSRRAVHTPNHLFGLPGVLSFGHKKEKQD